MDEADGGLEEKLRLRVNQDVALLCQLILRFIETRDLTDVRPIRVADFLLRKQIYRSLTVLMRGRVDSAWLERWVASEVDAVDPADDPSESGFFHVLEAGDPAAVDRMVVRMTERAFYMWLDAVCLDEDNQAFEKEDSPFGSREDEILEAITLSGRPLGVYFFNCLF